MTRSLAVTDGTHAAGKIIERDAGFDAYDVAGNFIGRFADQTAAARALPMADPTFRPPAPDNRISRTRRARKVFRCHAVESGR